MTFGDTLTDSARFGRFRTQVQRKTGRAEQKREDLRLCQTVEPETVRSSARTITSPSTKDC